MPIPSLLQQTINTGASAVSKRRAKALKRAQGDTWLVQYVWLLQNWKAATLLGLGRWAIGHWRLLAALIGPMVLGAYTGSVALAVVAYVALVVAVVWLRGRRSTSKDWWDHQNLTAALTAARIIPKTDGPPMVSFKGKPVHTDYGTAVKIGLPLATTYTDAAGKREALASALLLPAARLEVSQDRKDPANVVTLFVAVDTKGKGARPPVPAVVVGQQRTDASQPFRFGGNAHGGDEIVHVLDHNTLIAGQPGSGKTSLARIFLAWFLLDPTTRIFLLDGKGSVADYGAAKPLTDAFVSGTADDPAPELLAMLVTVRTLIQARNSTDQRGHAPVLLLLEEYQDVRADADQQTRDALDNELGRITRMGRAAAVHVLISTQRTSTDDLPSKVRNLLNQAVCLRVRNAADAQLVLGQTPPASLLPDDKGEALYRTPRTKGVAGIPTQIDWLSDDEWNAVCARATVLRAQVAAYGDDQPTTTLPAVDPALAEILLVLRDHGPLSGTDLLDRLPTWVRDTYPTAARVGLFLRNHTEGERAGTGYVRYRRGVNGRAWSLAETGHQPVMDLSSEPAQPDMKPAQPVTNPSTAPVNDGLWDDFHAHQARADDPEDHLFRPPPTP